VRRDRAVGGEPGEVLLRRDEAAASGEDGGEPGLREGLGNADAVRAVLRATRPRLTCAAMHIVLTDLLTCPRCGPAHGLILVADGLAERRVLDGALGCANCREKYEIRDGAAWFGSERHDGGAGGA